jgi:hypothetical protein
MFSLSAAPAGMVINASSGVITWTPSAAGTFPVTIVAANGVTPNATQSFSVTVTTDAPPTCALTEPVVDQVMSGETAEFFGDGVDDIGTVRAEFLIDGAVAYTDVNTSGHYHWRGGHALWDTTAYNDGPHQVTMKIIDTAGQSCEVEIRIVIDNGVGVPPGSVDGGTGPDAGGPAGDGGSPSAGSSGSGGFVGPGLQPPTGSGGSGRGGSSGAAGRGGSGAVNAQGGSAAGGDPESPPAGDPDLTGGCTLSARAPASHAGTASLWLVALAVAARRGRRRRS